MKIKIIICLTGFITSLSLNAAVFGNYQYENGYNNIYINATGKYVDTSNPNSVNKQLCTDTNARLVPGEVHVISSGTVCRVEWKGRISDNYEFYSLLGSSTIYEWSPITDDNRTSQKNYILANGVTNGGLDLGDFVFHCKAIKNTGQIYYGKYVPGNNKCYFGNFHSALQVQDSYNDYILSVLTAKL